MIGAVCVVTDPEAAMSVVEQARAAARGGAWAVQLRDKTASDAALHAVATALLPEMEALGVRLIIGGRIEVALRSGAHGLDIGQGDGDRVKRANGWERRASLAFRSRRPSRPCWRRSASTTLARDRSARQRRSPTMRCPSGWRGWP